MSVILEVWFTVTPPFLICSQCEHCYFSAFPTTVTVICRLHSCHPSGYELASHCGLYGWNDAMFLNIYLWEDVAKNHGVSMEVRCTAYRHWLSSAVWVPTSNSGWQSWQEASLPTVPSQPMMRIFRCANNMCVSALLGLSRLCNGVSVFLLLNF